jgi:hypothetical protein
MVSSLYFAHDGKEKSRGARVASGLLTATHKRPPEARGPCLRQCIRRTEWYFADFYELIGKWHYGLSETCDSSR